MNAVVHLPVLQSTSASAERPRTRGDCLAGGRNAERPCPWVSCEHHALLARLVGAEGGELDDGAAVVLLDTMPTCTLDVADHGHGVPETTLEAVGQLFGVTRERIRQIEAAAQKKLLKRVQHLADVIVEEPDPELRPSRCGPVPASEARSWTPAPAQHAHLPGPADVADGEGQMWCGHMGVALRAKLCVQRHTARGKGSAMSGAAGRSYPTYPDCARCPDGAVVAVRIGAEQIAPPRQVDAPTASAPEVPTAPTSAPIDWFGDAEGSVPANDCDSDSIDAPAAMGATEDDVSKKVTKAEVSRASITAMNAARVTGPAPGARCPVKGCPEAPQPYRESLSVALRDLCATHRQRAQWHKTKNACTPEEARAWVLRTSPISDGVSGVKGARKVSEAARHDLHAEGAREMNAAAVEREQLTAADEGLARVHADLDALTTELRQVQGERDEVLAQLAVTRLEITRLTGERESLRAERDKAYAQRRADLARIVTALVDESSQTGGVDDIVHGIEMVWRYAREDKTPWLRLERIYKAVHPASAGCWWTIERDTRPNAESARAWVAEIHDRDDVEGVDPVRAGHGPTPEAAIDELVKRVEEMAHDARETITAALESSR